VILDVDMDEAKIEPFFEATVSTLRDMAGVEVGSVGRVWVGVDNAPDELKAVIRLIAVREGSLMLSLSRQNAETITRKILEFSGGSGSPRELVMDALGEVVNVIAGQAKALLYGTPGHYTLGTPVVTDGSAAVPDGERWVVDFAGEGIDFRIHLWLPGNGKAKS
jgi:CheY-specific phosphatase CheX